MAYSVITGPINFGPAPPGQAGGEAFDVEHFMEQASFNAAGNVDLAAEHVHVQPAGSLPGTVVSVLRPAEHVHHRAPAQHAWTKDAAANAVDQTLQKPPAAAIIAPSSGKAGNKELVSVSGYEELTSVAHLEQPHDRQIPAPEVHEASAPLREEAPSSLHDNAISARLQHATGAPPEGVDANPAEPVCPGVASAEEDAFQASGSNSTAPASAGAAAAISREGPSSSRILQQHEHAAVRTPAISQSSAGSMLACQLDHTSEQHEEQGEAFLPELQPVLPDQTSSSASINHMACEAKGPAEAANLHKPEQPQYSLLMDPAAQAGTANMPHVTVPQSAPTQQDAVLQPEAWVVKCAEQQASPQSSPTRNSAGAILQESGGPDQDPGSNSDSVSASAGGIGVPHLEAADDAKELSGSSSAVCSLRPAAVTAGPAANAHSLHHSAEQAVPSKSTDAHAGTDSHVQAPDQHQVTPLPAYSAVPAAMSGKEPAQPQLHTTEEFNGSKHTEQTPSPYEGKPIAPHKAFQAELATSSSQAQPASSECDHMAAPDANGLGSTEQGPTPSRAPQAAGAEATHAAGTGHRQPEPEDIMKRMGPSMPRSDSSQAGSDRATHYAESEGATHEELLALADAVSRLESELAQTREAAARHEREAKAARQEVAQWRNSEADARAQMVAVREAYADMRSTAEAAQAQNSELQAAEKGLQKQLSTCAQQARASEESKMRSRLERAERAIEQERAANRSLQAALQACQQTGVAQEDASTGRMAAELAALRRDLAETSAALASQKASNKGLQIRVAELLKASTDMAALEASSAQLKQERDALLASKHRWTTNKTLVSSLKAQNNALHVTTEKLVSTNSELMERLNRQSKQVMALQNALAMAQAAQVPGKERPHQQASAGGARITETELELMALAEYVQELEGKLAKQQPNSAGRQGGNYSHRDSAITGALDSSLNQPGEHRHDTVQQLGTDSHAQGQEDTTKASEELPMNQQRDTVRDTSNLADPAGASTRGSGEADVFSDEQVDAIKAALQPQAVQQGQQKRQSRGFWGYITDYITGADKLIQ